MLALTTNIKRYRLFYHTCPDKTSRKQTNKKEQDPSCEVSHENSTGSHFYLWADVWGSLVHSSCCSAPMSHLSPICCCDDFCPAPLQNESKIRCPVHKWASQVCCRKYDEH